MTKELQKTETMVPSIYTEDEWQELLTMARNVKRWAKLVLGGFDIGGTFYESIEGVVARIRPHLIRWKGSVPEKIPNVIDDDLIPEGFERRFDLSVVARDGRRIGISLPKSSKYPIDSFVVDCDAQGVFPDQVFTELKAESITKGAKTFPVISFRILGPVDPGLQESILNAADEPTIAEPANEKKFWSPDDPESDEVPF